jgi:hypothetical protein
VTITQTYLSSVYIIASVTDNVRSENGQAPQSFSLGQNYPNPFNPTTTIRCGIATAAYADVSVYNLLGRRVATLLSGELAPGFYTTSWDGSDDRHVPVASGLYYLRIVATGAHGIHFSAVRKLLLMR